MAFHLPARLFAVPAACEAIITIANEDLTSECKQAGGEMCTAAFDLYH